MTQRLITVSETISFSLFSKMDVIYFKELLWRLRKTMPVCLAVHHKSAITTPPLRESSFHKEEPLFLRADPTHEVEEGKKGALNCREWGAQPFPAGPQGLLHFLTSPLGESPAPRTFGGRGPILDLPCRECSAAGQRGFRSCFHAPRPVGSGQPQWPSNPTSSRDWRAGRRRGRGRGRRAVSRARLLGALRYPRSGLPRPAQPRGGVRRADWRARGREGGRESEREREEGGRPAPRSAPRRRSHGGAPRLRAEDQQVRGGEPGRVSGGGGGSGRVGVARPPGLARRDPRPAARASPGPQGVRLPARRFFVSAVESAPALHAHAPAPGTPTKGTGEEATALTPAPAATADSTPGVPSAPPALHPRLHMHTKAAVQSCGLRDTGAPRFPPWAGWAPFLSPQGEMDDPTRTVLYAWA